MTINEIVKDLKYFDYKYNNYEILKDLFIMSALSISNSIELNDKIKNKREEEYKQIIDKYNKQDLDIFAKTFSKIIELYENNEISDFLGEIFMQSFTQNSGAKGQVFTPYALSVKSAEALINRNDFIDKDIVTMYEPACGGGGMIVAVIDILKNKLNIDYTTKLFVVAGDVDRRCVCMTYIALSLLGVPAIVQEKNALSGEIWDTFETPAYKMQYLRFKDVVRGLV